MGNTQTQTQDTVSEISPANSIDSDDDEIDAKTSKKNTEDGNWFSACCCDDD